MVNVMDNQSGHLIISVSTPDFGRSNVVINTEQLSRKRYADMIQSCLDANMVVLDYSPENIGILGNHPNHLWFPHPFEIMQPDLRTIRTKTVCMIGAAQSIRRRRIFDALIGMGIEGIWGWGDQRDKSIMDFKIVINIHYDDDYLIHEHLRCDRCIMNGLIVISESGYDDSLIPLRHHMIMTPYNGLVDAVAMVLADYDTHRHRLLPICDSCINQISNAHDATMKKLRSISQN